MSRHASVMVDGAAVANLAALLADRTRATICLALLDGRAWTVVELADQAGVARSTLSEHASQLVDAGLLAEERQGRHRYLRLADPVTASLIESLAVHAGPLPTPTSLRSVRAAGALAEGRTCYDHLAGRLGVELLDALVARGYVDDTDGLALTTDGVAWFGSHGVDVDALRAAKRPLVRPCLDWTERRHHLAGGIGAALLDLAVRERWVEREEGSRAVRLTGDGRRVLAHELGLGHVRAPA